MNRKKRSEKLIHKYTLEIRDEETLEKKLSFRLSRLNVFIIAGLFVVLLVIFVVIIISFTPVRYYIPGYADANISRKIIEVSFKLDSLERELNIKDLYIQNIRNILGSSIKADTPAGWQTASDSTWEEDTTNQTTDLSFAVSNNDEMSFSPTGLVQEGAKAEKYKNIKNTRSKEDSLLRQQIESGNRYDLSFYDRDAVNRVSANKISRFLFFTPLKGLITDTFSLSRNHYGIDIVAPKNEAVKAALDGTVILATWSSETGFVIGIQHENNLLTIYKHNSVLLKKEGNHVKVGEVIAIIGSSGELSTGPHLHFELWYNSNPLNPQDYMVF
ncbi:MAG: M23 family metallopeptidase [Bacteroidota bacterium]